MFELDTEVRNWRTRLERGSSLSTRELDELEDHLRARVELELELNSALAPREALAIAREGLGQPKAISREFARAGRPRWRRLLLAGWALYAVSFLLPALANPSTDATIYGYRVFDELGAPTLLLVMMWLPNLIMLTTLPTFWRRRRARRAWTAWVVAATGATFWRRRRARRAWTAWVVAATGALPLGLGLLRVANGGMGLNFGVGYWLWCASFAAVACALWLRNREGASIRPKQDVA
ncbi:hypothetical protein [Candidatus Palauibacter sp.]|uniref:hypothetical protein n=1 Tax=Candidatus Palauibacter sp. TaxID=3101350 RepID=UPI003B011338